MKFFKDLKHFISNLIMDRRIPSRDRILITILTLLLISPIDVIPDWIPIFGLLDDLIIIAMILNYFFKVLDSRIILSHYPWTMKSFSRLKAVSQLGEFIIPRILRKKVWKYTPDPY